MKEGERGPFSPKLRVRIKDNNSSPHGKFHRFLFPFSSKFTDLNFASYVLYIYLCGTHSEPGLPVLKFGLFTLFFCKEMDKSEKLTCRTFKTIVFVHQIKYSTL